MRTGRDSAEGVRTPTSASSASSSHHCSHSRFMIRHAAVELHMFIPLHGAQSLLEGQYVWWCSYQQPSSFFFYVISCLRDKKDQLTSSIPDKPLNSTCCRMHEQSVGRRDPIMRCCLFVLQVMSVNSSKHRPSPYARERLLVVLCLEVDSAASVVQPRGQKWGLWCDHVIVLFPWIPIAFTDIKGEGECELCIMVRTRTTAINLAPKKMMAFVSQLRPNLLMTNIEPIMLKHNDRILRH